MTFKMIEYVLAVYETGSFSRAAQQLFISQPALSQAIRKTEDELGAAIFVRDTHSVRLTAAGELLVREGRELLRQRSELRTRISGLSADPCPQSHGDHRGAAALVVGRGIRGGGHPCGDPRHPPCTENCHINFAAEKRDPPLSLQTWGRIFIMEEITFL